ncbi:PRD domain-containing protein [Xenorhabdus sp. Flor]|uniref:BglG family transcription antiterminator n=1 Tax=Xenorhabdus cabanillasii TaxID=351673 RepID=UPI0019C1CA16|nr:PRD domain-containing protein [Xenorhabdus sp. Flor]MBD2814555.1 PRD domain-containing protein [Xenorhabdus sp. Flor]
MLRLKQKELLDYLLNKNTPTLAIKLSQVLNVSTRTIKNYVAEINESYGEKIILSGRNGYSLSPDTNIKLHQQPSSQPKTYQERACFLIKSILLFKQSNNIYDLSADLYISDSTLRSLIYKMNSSFEQFNVRFLCRNNHIEILGAEQKLRELVYHTIIEKTGYRFSELKTLETIFGTQQVEMVSNLIKEIFYKWDYSVYDLSYANLVLHFLILINRLKHGNYLDTQLTFVGNNKLHAITDELCDNLQHKFDVSISENERNACYTLLKININSNHTKNSESIDLVDAGLYQFTKQITASVQEHYLVDFGTDDFISLFSHHISGLRTRLEYNIYTKNPMLEVIKKECRIIFDIAVFISLQLNEFLGKKLNEDEISFIALHVGAEFERQKSYDNKVRAVLLCPGYRGIENKIYHQLLCDFGNEISVIKRISQPSELETLEFELLITTINLPASHNYETVCISPFQLRNKRTQLISKIDIANANRKKRTLQRNFDLFFEQGLFWFEPGFQHRDALIDDLCQTMFAKGYVESDFVRYVHQRESASSTAFGILALPHSVKMDAIKTGVAVVISPKGIRWGKDERVHVIFLIAINKIDKVCFAECYDALLDVFSHDKIINQLHKITCFESFREMLIRANKSQFMDDNT